MLDDLPADSWTFGLYVADDLQPGAESLEELEPVIDVRVEKDTGEITVHTESDAGVAPGRESPLQADALVAAAARATSSSAELFWVVASVQ